MNLNQNRVKMLLGLPQARPVDWQKARHTVKRLIVKARMDKDDNLAAELSQINQMVKSRKGITRFGRCLVCNEPTQLVSTHCQLHNPRLHSEKARRMRHRALTE